MHRWKRLLVMVVTILFVLAACGDDDGSDVTVIDDGTSSTGSEAGSGSGVAAAEKECEPVGEDLEADADASLALSLLEYAFDPPLADVAAGLVTFEATNVGAEAHELAFLPGGGEVPFTDDGLPDEEALEAAGAFELEAFGPGQDCNATFEVAAGQYTMFCIVEAEDGETHYEKGMRGILTVE